MENNGVKGMVLTLRVTSYIYMHKAAFISKMLDRISCLKGANRSIFPRVNYLHPLKITPQIWFSDFH